MVGHASLVAQIIKNPPAMRETWVRSLGWEDPLAGLPGAPQDEAGLTRKFDSPLKEAAPAFIKGDRRKIPGLSALTARRRAGLLAEAEKGLIRRAGPRSW